jgi:hypothetical protein
VRREETGSDAWDTGVGYSSSIPPAPSSVPIPPNAAKWLQEGYTVHVLHKDQWHRLVAEEALDTEEALQYPTEYPTLLP